MQFQEVFDEMKTAEGIVVEVSGNTATIKTGRHNDCKNCGACPGNNVAMVCAKNLQNAKPGQRVLFEVKETNALAAAFIVFIFPLIGIFIGALIGSYIATVIGAFRVGFEILGGIFMFSVTLLCIKVFDHYVHKSEKSIPAILKIL